MLAVPRRRVRPRVIPPLPRLPLWRVRLLSVLAVLGPGLVSGFADNDAGGITTYSLAGAQWGYKLLWVILASQVVLFFTQEVGARLGLATGKGLMGLIRERWGVRWGAFAALAMLVANLGSTVAEFAGIGSALSLFGIPPQVSAAVAAVVVVAFIALGNYSRVQYLFVGVGVFVSIAYIVSAAVAQPDWGVALEPPRGPPAGELTALLVVRGRYRRHDDHAVGPGLHPVVRRRQGPPARGPDREPHRRLRRCAADQCHRGLHRRRLRGDALVTWADVDHERCRCRPRPRAAGRSGREHALRGRAARRLIPRARRRAAHERLHDLRGVRLGDGRELELARGPGVLRTARLLHRVRRPVRHDSEACP